MILKTFTLYLRSQNYF